MGCLVLMDYQGYLDHLDFLYSDLMDYLNFLDLDWLDSMLDH